MQLGDNYGLKIMVIYGYLRSIDSSE